MARKASIPDELAAEMPPVVRAFVESLLDRIQVLESKLTNTPAELLAPALLAACARQAELRPVEVQKEPGGQPGHSGTDRHLNPQVKRLGRDLMRPPRTLFHHWSRCREVNALLLRGDGTAVDGLCRELFAHREWLWTLLDVAGVQPTKYQAERSLHHAVFWRKLSFGTQSVAGSRFVETLLSVITTCRQQQRDA